MSASIEAVGLSRRFGDFTAVDRVTFEVGKGEIFGYLGANGAGKSTTIRMLTGLLAPSAGEARVAGYDVLREPDRVKAAIGYMSQKFSLYLDLPVIENLRFFAGAYGLSGAAFRARADELLERVDLRGHEQDTTGALPGGIRQRVALAGALLHRPGVVFLDEPTAGVDPVARRRFWRLIRSVAAEGTTVFVTTHYLDEAEYCARIGLMADGRLVALDTPAALKRTWVPGRIVVARGRGLVAAAGRLRAEPGVRAVAAFGAGLHVRVDPDALDPARVAALLAAAGAVDLHVEASEPTLEDVFLAVVDRGGASTAHLPHAPSAGAREGEGAGPGEGT
jgi:ABC-2 type transport system ATP-binding protein